MAQNTNVRAGNKSKKRKTIGVTNTIHNNDIQIVKMAIPKPTKHPKNWLGNHDKMRVMIEGGVIWGKWGKFNLSSLRKGLKTGNGEFINLQIKKVCHIVIPFHLSIHWVTP